MEQPEQRQGAPETGPSTPEMVTFAEAARRAGISKQRLSQLAHRNDFPVPQDQWTRVGQAYLVPWEPIRDYLAQDRPRGIHLAARRRKGETN